MSYLIDTSVLARLANNGDAFHAVAVHAVVELHRRGDVLHIAPQVLIEFRSVATRPVKVNGLGLSVQEAKIKSAAFEAVLPMIEETPAVFPAWKVLVDALGITGKQVHDARIAAICHVCGATHLLTFNVSHFTRLAAIGPGIVVVDPATL
jgi:predicted nucleic acid-binding protein